MRIKSQWFKSDREKTTDEIAGAMAFTAWKIAENSLKNTRNAKFDIEIGPQYFGFLSEFLIFLIQVSDRIAYRQFSNEERVLFTGTLANRVAETLAENKSRLLGGTAADRKQEFIDLLNQRSGEYAEFDYGPDGPEFAFTRYVGFCMRDVMNDADVEWVADQIMTIEAPNAVDMVEKTLRNLLGNEPKASRARAGVSGD
jgi:hypothetical protein